MLLINQHIMTSSDLCPWANVMDQLNNEYNNLYDKYKLLQEKHYRLTYDKVIADLTYHIEACEDSAGWVERVAPTDVIYLEEIRTTRPRGYSPNYWRIYD